MKKDAQTFRSHILLHFELFITISDSTMTNFGFNHSKNTFKSRFTLFLLLSTASMSNAFAVQGKGNNRWSPQTLRASASDNGENVKTIDILSLDSIRSSLIRQEETIIFALIERSQFLQNQQVYEKGAMGSFVDQEDPSESLSFLEYMLMGTVSFL